MSESFTMTIDLALESTEDASAQHIALPSRGRMAAVEIALQAARRITDEAHGGGKCIWNDSDKEDAAIVVTAILSAVTAVSRRSCTQIGEE